MESVGLLTQMGIKVTLGVLLAVAAAALARRFHRLGNGVRAQAAYLQVAETAGLGQNRSLHLIRVGRRALLIGSTPSAISLLADLSGDRGPVLAAHETEPFHPAGPRQAFAALLSRLLKPASGPSHPDRADRLRTAAQALRAPSRRSSRA
ncbi:MAG TPA: flagellar biosynthetic protein FliO [Armatimonadota bacterium]|nr:flagellar biosynthetic protein FliO [Armatimonadota bacterium]